MSNPIEVWNSELSQFMRSPFGGDFSNAGNAIREDIALIDEYSLSRLCLVKAISQSFEQETAILPSSTIEEAPSCRCDRIQMVFLCTHWQAEQRIKSAIEALHGMPARVLVVTDERASNSGFFFSEALRSCICGIASTIDTEFRTLNAAVEFSWTSAPVRRNPSGMPCRSAIRLRLVPGRPRSVGFEACRSTPLLAAMDELSMQARLQSIRSASRNWRSSSRCRRSHIPAACQSRSRRQQVTSDPHPILAGSISHGMPVHGTDRMPVNAARAGTDGRPSLGFGGTGGSIGSMINYSDSGRSGVGMASQESDLIRVQGF